MNKFFAGAIYGAGTASCYWGYATFGNNGVLFSGIVLSVIFVVAVGIYALKDE